MALSFPELRDMLEQGEAQGQKHFVIVFHSFSAVKPKDVFYTALRPDRVTISGSSASPHISTSIAIAIASARLAIWRGKIASSAAPHRWWDCRWPTPRLESRCRR